MEDAHIVMPDIVEGVSLFAIFDGHGGKEVAQFCSQHMPTVGLAQLAFFAPRPNLGGEGVRGFAKRNAAEKNASSFTFTFAWSSTRDGWRWTERARGSDGPCCCGLGE